MLYKSKGNPIIAVQIDDDISFIAPWGEMMNIAAGGYIVLSECETYMASRGKNLRSYTAAREKMRRKFLIQLKMVKYLS